MSNTTNKEKAGETKGFGLLFSCSIPVLFSHCIVSRTVFPEYHGDPAAGAGLVFHADVGIVPLYYNENGGNYYHTMDMCSAVGADYLPLTGKLIYEDLSVGKFKSLKHCTTCSAPVRPHTH